MQALYLKTLSLAGFKSFADRTRLEFGPGVNVVVGPNGAGKSNLVDAVSWVMGTQAASSLRTHKMDEVIFSGTAIRPAHGRAEVSLTFDNASGALPLDLGEVTITRRLYRDGTSEYEINGASCRLMDVQELLADSGVGRHQHVIVGQGRIGTILSARPDEHRAVIEEAAGVTKHRGRRDRAVRRLEQTDLDVARLRDILTEQQRRMRPLKRQANAAERHESVKAEAKALRLWLGGEEIRRIDARLGEVEAEQAALSAESASAQQDLDRVKAALPELEKDAGELGRALERDTSAAARLETAAERLQRIAMVARERRLAVESRMRGAGDRRRDLESELTHLDTELAAAVAQERTALTRAERREVALRGLEDEERSLAEQAQLPAEGVVASLRGDLRALESATQRDQREAEAVARRLEVVGEHLDELDNERVRLDEEIKATDAELAKVQPAYERARADRDRCQQELEAAEASVQETRLQAAACQARVEALETALAGLSDPEARDHVASLEQVVGSVASRLDVPSDFAAAVDAALGTWNDAFVAAGADALEEVIATQKAAGHGGVGVVAAAAPFTVPAREVAAEWGLDALVDRLGPEADAALAARLLGDVVVVEGWSAGWKLVGRHPGLRAVTPEGDLIAVFGIRPAVPDGAGPAALETARGALEAADTQGARAESIYSSARRAFEQSRQQERLALETVEDVEARLAGATEALRMVEQSRRQSEEEYARLEERRVAVDEAMLGREERLAELRLRLGEFEGEESARQRAWEELNRRREDVAARRDQARIAREEAAAALATIEERRRITEQRLAAVRTELDSVDDDSEPPADPGRLETVEQGARRALEVVRRHVDVLRGRQRELRAEAGTAGSALEESHGLIRDLEHRINAARERGSDLKVELTELRMRRESVAEGLRRDADAEEAEALAALQPEMPEDIDPAEHLLSLDNRLRRMGPINPLAAAEYKELAERAEFLQGQIDDLDESRRELRKVISALDEQIAVEFRQAFDEIAAFYEENFTTLFPGGKGKLRITEPDDVLNTGVEIAAQPLGKKVSRLALLSGGERSLAALAFLFAVFRARPSPFYILDEVEAALDDANLRRFIRLVETLRGSAQLTIVTHQQHTMESADTLYGVTMEPGESSTVVAKRLSEVRV